MMVMTAKVDFKKVFIAIAAVAALVLSLVLLFGGKETAAQTGAPAAGSNDARVKFLTNFGWNVTSSPKESSAVLIPQENGEVFLRYNALQKSQGYDLTKFAGKKVMRYVYEITNFPGATAPVYATLLVSNNEIIGGDVTDTAAKGKIQGFQMPKETKPTAPAETTTQTAPSAENTSEATKSPI